MKAWGWGFINGAPEALIWGCGFRLRVGVKQAPTLPRNLRAGSGPDPPRQGRMTLMFSATFPKEIQKLAQAFMRPTGQANLKQILKNSKPFMVVGVESLGSRERLSERSRLRGVIDRSAWFKGVKFDSLPGPEQPRKPNNPPNSLLPKLQAVSKLSKLSKPGTQNKLQGATSGLVSAASVERLTRRGSQSQNSGLQF